MPPHEITFSLSHEELVYVLHILQIPTLPGLPLDLVGDIPTDYYQAFMGMAERALRARGLLQLEGDSKGTIDSFLMGIVGLCTKAEYGFLISRTHDTTQENYVYHFADNLAIRHFADQGIHQFTLFDQFEGLAYNVLETLCPLSDQQQTKPAATSFEVPYSLFMAVRLSTQLENLSEQNLQEALNHYLDPQISAQLTEIFRDQVEMVSTVAYWRLPSNMATTAEITLFITSQGLWTMAEAAPDVIRLSPLDTVLLQKKVHDFLGVITA